MFRIALVPLALALASCVQEPQHAPPADAINHVVITCDVPGPKPRRISVPDGQNPTDFCPVSAIAYHFGPGANYYIPKSSDIPPPTVMPATGKLP